MNKLLVFLFVLAFGQARFISNDVHIPCLGVQAEETSFMLDEINIYEVPIQTYIVFQKEDALFIIRNSFSYQQTIHLPSGNYKIYLVDINNVDRRMSNIDYIYLDASSNYTVWAYKNCFYTQNRQT